ncbi:MAG: DUF423 domain-containing protein [Pseudomonadota bacterium]
MTGFGALLGFVAVALGAFGAHSLGDSLSAKQTGWWDTATLYLLVHAALVTALSLAGGERYTRAALVMALGAALFAATLYAMALGAPTWLGAVTPIGGLGMLAGWAMIAWTGLKS